MNIKKLFEEQIGVFEEIYNTLEKNIEKMEIKTRDESSNNDFIKIQPIISDFLLNEEALEKFIFWQITTAAYLKKYSEEYLYELFQDLTSPSEKNSLFNMILLKEPWLFTDWGYSKKNKGGKDVLFLRKYSDYYKLAELNNISNNISEQDKLVSDYIRTGYEKKLKEIEYKIKAILRSPFLIEEAKAKIKIIENKKIQENRGNMVNLALEEIERDNDFGLAIGAFLLRYVMENTLKENYSLHLQDSSKKKTFGSIIHHLYTKQIITGKEKDEFLKINAILTFFIHPQDKEKNKYTKSDLLGLVPFVKKMLIKYG